MIDKFGGETKLSGPHLGATAPTEPRPAPRSDARAYLLVFDGPSSSMFDLDEDATLVVGRAEDAGLRIDNHSISRQHCQVSSVTGVFQVADLNSRNGTQVNGRVVVGQHTLRAGDEITIGQVTLVFHQQVLAPERRRLVSVPTLRARFQEEVARSLRYGRPVAVVYALIEATAAQNAERVVSTALRVADQAAWDSDGRLMVILPEASTEDVTGFVGRLRSGLGELGAVLGVGAAICPTDGLDIDTLLAAALAAARVAERGQVAYPSSAARLIQVGDISVVVADAKMQRVFSLIERLAVGDLPVLVRGETGAGKEIVSRALHFWSPRKAARLQTINCAAIPDTLIESELFGYEKGAFSGAAAAKPGLFETANGGTVFLDEIGELSPPAQAKLLRVLEDKKVTRLGALKDRPVDIRLVAATHRDLMDDVATGRFRRDLYYRLSAATVILPPLRDRHGELPILLRAFLKQAADRLGREAPTISPSAMRALLEHPWPGNIRELRNIADFLVATVEGVEIADWHLPPQILGPEAHAGRATTPAPAAEVSLDATPDTGPSRFRPIADELRELEQRRMAEALAASSGNQTRAAELISMPLRTFVGKMKQYELVAGRKSG